MIHAELGNWKRHLKGEPWDRIYTFLKNDLAAAPEDEKIDLGAGVFARIMRYDTIAPEEAKLEAHDTYADIQISIENSETIRWYPRGILTQKTAYNEERDVLFFHPPAEKPSAVCNRPGRFSVFFPEDAHMPKLITDGTSESVKKAVVKVPVSLLPE
jgi:biofilm protein TabA